MKYMSIFSIPILKYYVAITSIETVDIIFNCLNYQLNFNETWQDIFVRASVGLIGI